MKTIAEKDIQAIEAHGLTVKQIEGQLKDFEKGFPYANLIEPATLEKGIVKLGKGQISDLLNEYESLIHKEKIVKFVPASGAATRMFKKLFALAETFTGSPEDYVSLAEDNGPMSLQFLFDNLDKLSFYDELKKTLLKDGLELEELIAGKQYGTIAEYILEEKGLGYGALPKGLILFHKYEDETRLALEEHFPEAYNYCLNEKGTSIHFTVSPEHLELFRKEAEYLTNKYHNLYGIRPEVSFSTQKSSTDTIAVTTDNAIFRDKQGQPVFRPAGHGALIENLNDLDAGIIFIKNIDNVVPDEQKEDTYTFKKACGALLLQLRNKTFEYLQQLDEADVTDDELQDMYDFAVNKLFVSPFSDFALMNRIEKVDYLYSLFNRPMRICGMVKNEGEPGGGPFWVKDSNGRISLQIVESAQIDKNNSKQQELFKSSTHFNPVDLVCSKLNYQGEPFDLLKFTDPQTGFISEKSKDGMSLKALEMPGLWNGAMADWISVFVEVPLSTFNPVKEVNDLLRPQHL